MSEIVSPLTLDLLAWLASGPRDYDDVIEAWRTSCPRLTIWEDAVDANLVGQVHRAGRPIQVELTPNGQALLANCRR